MVSKATRNAQETKSGGVEEVDGEGKKGTEENHLKPAAWNMLASVFYDAINQF